MGGIDPAVFAVVRGVRTCYLAPEDVAVDAIADFAWDAEERGGMLVGCRAGSFSCCLFEDLWFTYAALTCCALGAMDTASGADLSSLLSWS